MKITYTGKLEELKKDQKKNLESHYAKLGKLVDKRGEREAHVMLTTERRLHKAEITMTYYGRQAVGCVKHKDQFLALLAAIVKLETQMHKMHDKWNDAKRHADNINGKKAGGDLAVRVEIPSDRQKPSVVLAKVQRSAKPLTVEEAVLTIRPKAKYLVFEDAETNSMSVMARADDGTLELIETQ